MHALKCFRVEPSFRMECCGSPMNGNYGSGMRNDGKIALTVSLE